MSLNHHFSKEDPRVLEAVEKQYLYGRTKDVLKNFEKDILDIVKDIERCKRLEIELPDRFSEIQLIIVALSRLNKRHFSKGDMQVLAVLKRRCHTALNELMDMLDLHDTDGYARAASNLLGALYAVNPPLIDKHGLDGTLLTDEESITSRVLGKVLDTLDSIEDTEAKWREKREMAAKKNKS